LGLVITTEREFSTDGAITLFLFCGIDSLVSLSIVRKVTDVIIQIIGITGAKEKDLGE
jgi:hypothetical protein